LIDMRARCLLLAGGLAAATVAGATVEQPGDIVIGELPETHGQWIYGEAIVAAPAAVVQRWLDDIPAWPQRYRDVEWAQSLGTNQAGEHIVRFRSSIIGRTLTLRMLEQPGRITYEGEGKNVTTRGRIFVDAIDAWRTRVTLQTTSEVHGLAGVFATQSLKRQRAEQKIRSDLTSLVREGARSAAHRSRPAPLRHRPTDGGAPPGPSPPPR
jgi:hypothetical protein